MAPNPRIRRVRAAPFRAVRTVLFIIPMAFSYAFGDVYVAPWAENHPILVGILYGVLALVIGLVWLVFKGGLIAALAIMFLIGVGFGWIKGWDSRDNYLQPYCRYGAKSQAQIDTCLSNVNSDDIDKLDTNAARFARGDVDCRADAGPYCAAAAKER